MVCLQIAGEQKVMAADTEGDCQQVLRHLGEIHPSLPLWRQQRPALHLDSMTPQFNTADASAQGTVVIRYLSAVACWACYCCGPLTAVAE